MVLAHAQPVCVMPARLQSDQFGVFRRPAPSLPTSAVEGLRVDGCPRRRVLFRVVQKSRSSSLIVGLVRRRMPAWPRTCTRTSSFRPFFYLPMPSSRMDLRAVEYHAAWKSVDGWTMVVIQVDDGQGSSRLYSSKKEVHVHPVLCRSDVFLPR